LGEVREVCSILVDASRVGLSWNSCRDNWVGVGSLDKIITPNNGGAMFILAGEMLGQLADLNIPGKIVL
jgi:hypothetical protein